MDSVCPAPAGRGGHCGPDESGARAAVLAREAIRSRLPVVDSSTDIGSIRERLSDPDDEFCFSFSFTPEMLDRYCWHGFLPMSCNILGVDLLALKLHHQRILMPPSAVKVRKATVNRFRDCEITVDGAFCECVTAINERHQDSWLSAPLVDLFSSVNANPPDCRGPAPASRAHGVGVHSVELRRGGELIAGEIGYTVGTSYTSLTGFRTVSDSGTAQLWALAKVLGLSGFVLWDLGMHAPYKTAIGGKSFEREGFLDALRSVRDGRAAFIPGPISIGELERGTPQ